MSFGKRLKLALKYKGLTQKEFAAAMQVSPPNVNQYIQDRRQPSREYVHKMAEILNLDYGYTPEGEPFFYVFPKVADFPEEIKDFNSRQMLDALGDPGEEIQFDDSDLIGTQIRSYRRMDKVFAFKIQFDLLKLNIDGKILVSERIRELLKNPKYRVEDITNDFLAVHPKKRAATAPDQGETAPDEPPSSNQKEPDKN